MDKDKILAAAKAAPQKIQLEEFRDAVETLREKGYTWREIADFLNEQGVQTDHTRVYRTFEKSPMSKRSESREIKIRKATYVGERKTKKNNTWSIVEFELPSKLGKPLTFIGHAWGKGAASYQLGKSNRIQFRDPTLVVKTGDRFPFACIKAEFLMEDDYWQAQDVYIMPKWESLL